MSDQIIFTPHSKKQEDLIFSDADITVLSTGTQFGKSIAGTLWLQRQTFTYTEKTDNFIIAAPTYKILNQSIIPYFLHHMGPFGTYNKSDGVFKLNEGGTIYLRTETDPESIVGIPNVRAGWLDEAGKLRLYFWENYQARAASKGAKTLLTTSPYSLNWLYHRLVKPAIEGKRPDIKLIQAASWESPYHALHDPAKRKAIKDSMDSRRFDMLFGGEWGQMQGLVYDCFCHDENQCDPMSLPSGTRYYGGIDWGFTEPFVLSVRAVTPDGKQYKVSEFYKSGLTITDIILVLKQKKEIFGIQSFFAGKDQPGYIDECNRAGLGVIGADNDVRRGIDAHYELLKTRKLKLFRGLCPFTIDELETYHYPEIEDLRPDDNAKEKKPVQQNDHALDSDRYISISLINHSSEKRVPAFNGESAPRATDTFKYIESLKKKRPQKVFY